MNVSALHVGAVPALAFPLRVFSARAFCSRAFSVRALRACTLSVCAPLVCAIAQQPVEKSTPQPPSYPPEFVPIGGVVQIVNDDAITAARLERSLADLRKRFPVTTREEFEQLLALARRRAIEERLQTQAGENMGFDAAEVEHRVKWTFDKRKDEQGLQTLASFLKKQGLGAGGARENMQDLTYQASWFYAETGAFPGVRGRVWRDDYVRPGEMHYIYSRSTEELGEPDKVVLQLLDTPAAAHGGLEQAREALTEIRAKVAAGESFDDYVDELSETKRANKGVQPEIEVPSIAAPDVRAFARTAEIGQISEPLPWTVDGVKRGWRLVRLVERREGKPAPSFESSEMQKRLRDHVQDKRKELWLEQASERMLDAAWTWPKVDLGAPPPAAQASTGAR